ncbi:CHASE2 domain-containing protein [Pantanalinema sp. GBBB05]|uniref:CHASE2 domain-containing protein n=1 Tax=Pantanalinema sp. GBBB05 TaxID=2604139 RepID=UPI001DB54547|nr:CHASE2 domain-containing protein [Pantanalinema sp. GBBB05]
MSRVVVLRFEGDLKVRGFQVTLEIRSESNQIELEGRGQLPPNLALVDSLHNWQDKYRNVGAPARIKPKQIIYDGNIQQRRNDCKQAAVLLRDRFTAWLKLDSFRSVDLQLREELQRDEEIRLLLRSADQKLQKLPWHEWDFVQRYPNTEVVLTPWEQKRRQSLIGSHQLTKNRILAILGHRHGIDVDVDRQLLEHLPNSEVTFLVEPLRQELGDRLWEQSWDVIFFAGHSETEGETGRIYLNPTDSLTIEELWYTLRKAVDRGLKLAIFNSCDGLGLVQQLDDLAIPHLIVMRELVPDRVAQEFLKYLLSALSASKPVHLAVREARERLEALEPEFPCATWLPVMHQSTDYIPISIPPDPKPSERQRCPVKQLLFVSLVVTTLVMGIRWTGLLQSAELQAYDHLMRSRPIEQIDRNIVVVEVTQENIKKPEDYPVKDAQLAQLIQKIQMARPRAIGLAMHRFQARPPGREDLIAQFKATNLSTVCSFWSEDVNYSPPPELSDQQKVEQVGFSDALPDEFSPSSDVIRRQLLAYDPEFLDQTSSCNTPYSFSWLLARQFLRAEGIFFDSNSRGWEGERVTLQPLKSRAGGYQQLDGRSNQILINYRSRMKPTRSISMNEALQGERPELMRDRLVLIGHGDHQYADRHHTPIGELTGVWIFAHVISQIINAELGGRALIWVLPQWKDLQWGDSLFVALWALLGSGIIWIVRSPWWLIGFIGMGLFLLYQICLILLVYGGWMPLIPAAIAFLVTSSCIAYLRYR